MALNERQERRLARQRGAGTRELKNATFGFSFAAAPLPPRNSSRKTPRATARDSSAGRRSLQGNSTRRSSRTPNPGSETRKQPTPVPVSSTRTPQARQSTRSAQRQPSIASDVLASAPSARQNLKTPATTGKRKRSTPSTVLEAVHQLSGDELEVDDARYRPLGNRTPATGSTTSNPRASAALDIVHEDPDELLEDDIDHLLSSAIRFVAGASTVSGQSRSGRPRQSQIGEFTQPTDSPSESRLRGRLVAPQPDTNLFITPSQDNARNIEDDLDELSPEINSTTQAARMHASTPRTAYVTVVADQEVDEVQEDPDPLQLVETDAEDDEFDPATRPRQKRRRVTAHQPSKAGAVKPKRPDASDPKPKPVKDTGKTVPIVVHQPRLPEDSVLEDPLGFDPNPAQNPADVFAQITSELNSNYIDAFSQEQKPTGGSGRKAFRRQKKALKLFNHALQDTLFNISVAANTGTVLGSRLRRTARELTRLREELISIKQQRNEIELEKDSVRTRHDQTVSKREWQRELAATVGDVAEAISRGRERAVAEVRDAERPEEEGMGAIYDAVSSMVGKDGLAMRLTAFNGSLQHTARLLEGMT